MAGALNGEESKAAKQILLDAAKALIGARFSHIVGSAQDDRGVTFQIEADFDAALQRDREVMMTAGWRMERVAVGGRVYELGDATAWEQNSDLTSQQVALVASRWIQSSVEEGGLATRSLILKDFADPLSDPKTAVLPQVIRSTDNGRPVLIVTGSDGSRTYVANTGIPFPVRIDGATAPQEGIRTVRISDFDSPVTTIAAPSDALDSAALPGLRTPSTSDPSSRAPA